MIGLSVSTQGLLTKFPSCSLEIFSKCKSDPVTPDLHTSTVSKCFKIKTKNLNMAQNVCNFWSYFSSLISHFVLEPHQPFFRTANKPLFMRGPLHMLFPSLKTIFVLFQITDSYSSFGFQLKNPRNSSLDPTLG